VAAGDYRFMVAGRQTHFAKAPLFCVLVSDYSKFPFGDEDQRLVWASEDAGIVSQNISIFCAATGLATRPRASMDLEKLGGVLKLKDTQHLVLNSPVSYIRR
jgi:nitroreductase